MGNIAVQWSMDIGQSIAESRPTEMFWMKNHSSAYFIMPRCPILAKIHDFYSSFQTKFSAIYISVAGLKVEIKSKSTSQPVNFAWTCSNFNPSERKEKFSNMKLNPVTSSALLQTVHCKATFIYKWRQDNQVTQENSKIICCQGKRWDCGQKTSLYSK